MILPCLIFLLLLLYNPGVNNVFQDISLQTIFWLRAFSIDGKISLTQPVYVSSKLPQEELKDYSFDDMMKVSKLTMIVRCIADLTVNMFGVFFVSMYIYFMSCESFFPSKFILTELFLSHYSTLLHNNNKNNSNNSAATFLLFIESN